MRCLSEKGWSAGLVLLLTACGGGGGREAPDPLFTDQWHLKNTGQLSEIGVAAKVGEDINVEPVWNGCDGGNTCRGEGIRIAVVDNGMEIRHEDLATNVAPNLSYNYLTNGTDPTPPNGPPPIGGDYTHGTAVSGIIAARDLNGVGVRGVAPRANIVAYNLLLAQSTSNEADAMTRGSPSVHVSNNSWGPNDGRGLLDAPPIAWYTAIDFGLSNGRDGKGTIYVWAAGNGATGSGGDIPCWACVDNSNYDGYANDRRVIAVGAVNDQGMKASYSERGANVFLSAPGGDFCNTHTISTTDRVGENGYNTSSVAGVTDYENVNYTKCMNGTSAAAPVVSGVVALVLQANPNLGWRDVRAILARSARKNDPSNADWVTNGANFNINHNYGFGVVDSNAAVTMAKIWANLGAEKMYVASLVSPNILIPDNNSAGVSSTATVTGSTITEIESIEITFSADDHAYSGDLEITLTNVTTDTISRLSETHLCVSNSCTAYDTWIFSSARHLGEAADGDWILTVKDLRASKTGTFLSWSLTFYGT